MTLGWGQKVKFHLTLIAKSISNIFIPNFVCVLTNKRYKTYRIEFSFCCLVMYQGCDFGVLGAFKFFGMGICDGALHVREHVFEG